MVVRDPKDRFYNEDFSLDFRQVLLFSYIFLVFQTSKDRFALKFVKE